MSRRSLRHIVVSFATLLVATSGSAVLVTDTASASSPHGSVAPHLTAATRHWTNALPAPGTYSLNAGGNATVTSVACVTAGNCVAGGSYTNALGRQEAMVDVETNGVWGSIQDVAGVSALNDWGAASVTQVTCTAVANCVAVGFYSHDTSSYGRILLPFTASLMGGVWGGGAPLPNDTTLFVRGGTVSQLSCAATGYCVAVGSYLDVNSVQQSFVSSEVKGVWSSVVDIPGTDALNVGKKSAASAVSCATTTNCLAGGTYRDNGSLLHAYLATFNGTTWSDVAVPGLDALSSGTPNINAISCTAVNTCLVAGSYVDFSSSTHGFLISENAGVWTTLLDVTGLPIATSNSYVSVSAATCLSTGNCTVAGTYSDASSNRKAFVMTETAKSWGTPTTIAGMDAVHTPVSATVTSVSCASAGNCYLVGTFKITNSTIAGFAAAQIKGVWGAAQQLSGVVAVSTNGASTVSTVSCVASGSCVYGGSYPAPNGFTMGFTTTVTSGVAGALQVLPGSTDMNPRNGGAITSISCWSAGNCSAGGYYADSTGNLQAMVVNETDGTWGAAQEVPGTAALNSDSGSNGAEVTSLSCPAAGTCTAVGFFSSATIGQEGFVVNETKGVWGTAVEPPNFATVNASNYAALVALSCSSAGTCLAGGNYIDGDGNQEALLVPEVNGVWGNTFEVPGSGALNTGGTDNVSSISCASTGNCLVGGVYTTNGIDYQGYITEEKNGVWSPAAQPAGFAALNAWNNGYVNNVSCAAAGYCTIVGTFTASGGSRGVFGASEVKGTWGTATILPGFATLNSDGNGSVQTLSCASAGNCVAGGQYRVSSMSHAWTDDEKNGVWSKAQAVPGAVALDVKGGGTVQGSSCWSAGNCTVVGNYTDASGAEQPFIAEEWNGVWSNAFTAPNSAALNIGNSSALQAVSCATDGGCSTGGFFSIGTPMVESTIAPPTAPTGVVGKYTKTTVVTITWHAPADDGGAPVQHYTCVFDGHAYAATTVAGGGQCLITTTKAKHHLVSVTATNAAGTSPASPNITV